MADKNQQNILNGTPPQLIPSDSNPNYVEQSNLMTSPSVEQSSYATNPTQKRQVLMVNGQIPTMNVRNSNSIPGQLPVNSNDNTNDNRLAHNAQTSSQHVAPALATKSNPSLPGSQFPKVNYGPVPNLPQKLPPQSQALPPPLFNSNSQPGMQFPQRQQQQQQQQQPSPQLGSKPSTISPGNSHAVHSLPPQTQFQQTNRTNPVPQQQAITSPYPGGGPPVAKPTNELPKALLPQPYDSSPQLASPSVNSNPSPLHQAPGKGSQPLPTFPGPAYRSFPPPPPAPSNPPGPPRARWPGAQPPPSAPPPSQPFRGHGEPFPPNFAGQATPTRTLARGPMPPMSSPEVPPVVPVPRGPIPSVANRMPSPHANFGNSKYPAPMNALSQDMEKMSVTKHGFNRLWGLEAVDLLQHRSILPPQRVVPPPIRLNQEFMDSVNCSSEIFCCTMNKIPETHSLLQKSRLPLGILIHPFRDLNQLAVIQCSSIVRCRACRTYINPFVYFVDNKRWKCNLCFRINELPDEFQYDPVSKTYGDPSRRPEIRNSTIEFIAPSEYMLRPPQPAIYLFVLDVSRSGCDSGYLETVCSVLLDELDNLPGDCRTQIGFILFDSCVHFFSMAENYAQAHEMIVTDINDVFLPTPDSLLVNLNESKQLVRDLLQELPKKYAESFDTNSAMGAALQAAYKLMTPTGGRITVFQSCLPNVGPGSLSSREDPNQRSAKDVRHLGPQTDFYKRLSLDCSTQQISVDLFLVSSQYSDLATIGGISQFSGGCIYYFPLFRKTDVDSNERLIRALRRYLTRKIGFEAVMRVRCSRGLAINTFHGNFFVRSTDLLSLPNVNPDAGFGMQVSIEDSLCELQTVCFQAAVLYTSAKGERRIRVHTLCLPVSSNLSDILTSADQQAIVGLLGKMAVDRSLKSSLSDAREAFINVPIDILSAYRLIETSCGPGSVLSPLNLSLIPLYVLALLKSTAFRTGQSTRLDDRVFAMLQMKTLPLRELIQQIHPDLYNVTQLDDQTEVEFEEKAVAQPRRLPLSGEYLDSRGVFLLDTPEVIYLFVGKNVDRALLANILDVSDLSHINKDMVELPEVDTEESDKLRHFVNYLQSEKAWPAVVKVVTDPNLWQPFLVNDKSENAFSYFELLHHIKSLIK